LAGFID